MSEPILAVYYMLIMYIFAQIIKYFAFSCLFLSFFLKVARMPLLPRIGPVCIKDVWK